MSKHRPIGVFSTLKMTPVPVRYLLGGVLINQLGAFVQTFLLLYLTFRGVEVGAAGLCLVAYSVGSILGTMLGGELTQRFGPRAVIVSAMAFSGPLVIMIPWLSGPGTFWLLIGVVALAGLATQSYRPAAAVLLSDLIPERYQVMGFSMMRIALNIGAALAPLIAAGLILIDWDLLYWFDGLTALVYAALAFVLLPKQRAPRASTTDAEPGIEPATTANSRSAYAVMVRDRRFLYYLAAVLLGTITYVQSTTALPLEVISDGYPTGLYSLVLTISSVVLITCELKLTTYIVKLPTHIAVFFGHLVNSLGFVAFAFSVHSSAFIIVGAVLAVSGLMIAGPSMFAHPATFPAAVKARYVGTMQAVAGLAAAVGFMFGVYAWTNLGGGFWLWCAILNGVAGLLALAGLRRKTEVGSGSETGLEQKNRIKSRRRKAMHEKHSAAGPVVIVGFVGVTLEAVAEIQGKNSVIYVEEPDIVRKRHVRDQLDGKPFVRGLIEWEYHLAGKADEFYNAYPDLEPSAIIPAIEYATPFAARLAERYNLPGAGLGAALILRDKALLRQVSAAAGVANPASVTVTSPSDVRAFMRAHPGPIVLKPSNRQASVGTQVIEDPAEVEFAWSNCLIQDEGVFVPDRPMELCMLAERYVAGREYSVEMLVQDGVALFVNVTGKQLFPGPRPVELTHVVPADIPTELADLLRRQTALVVEAVGFRVGIIHCEWIVSDNIAYLVECAGRLAGDGIIDIIQRAYPIELLRCYYSVMKGEQLPSGLPQRAKGAAAVRFLAIEPGVVEGVRGVADAQQADGVFLVHVGVSPGDRFAGLRCSWDRAGIVMVTADNPAEALRLAEQAAGLVRIDMSSAGESNAPVESARSPVATALSHSAA